MAYSIILIKVHILLIMRPLHLILQFMPIKNSQKKSFFFDAPVSGGEIGAKKGLLSVMIGGYKKHLKKLYYL